MLDEGNASEAEQQRINGVVDVPRAGRVAGWAIDRADPGVAVVVTVLREGRPVAELRADAHRADLEKNGIGTGRYGFALDLDPPLEPGFEFTISAVAHSADGASGILRPVGRARPSDAAERRLLERIFLALPERPAPDTGLAAAAERLEIVQARLERVLAEAERPAAARRGRGVAALAALALLVGTGSLGLGLWSMLGG